MRRQRKEEHEKGFSGHINGICNIGSPELREGWVKKCLFLLSVAFWMPENISCSIILHIIYLNFKSKVKKRRAIVYNSFNNLQ